MFVGVYSEFFHLLFFLKAGLVRFHKDILSNDPLNSVMLTNVLNSFVLCL